MTTETELKLRIAPDDIKKLLKHPLLRSITALNHSIYNTYFDTEDHQLLQQGLGLRIRQIENKRIQTLKTRGSAIGGLHHRQEWEAEVNTDFPNCLDWTVDNLPPICRNMEIIQHLKPLFTTDFTRLTWNLELEDHTRIELALDQGHIKTGDNTLPLCEIELELKAGTPDRLFQLALTLQKKVPLCVENQTKAARGYYLHRSPPLSYHKAGRPPVFEPHCTVEQAFINIVRHCLEHWQANEEVVLKAGDVEGIHQLRVALRRLRSILSIFNELIPNKSHTRIRQDLKVLARLLGSVRDLDVFDVSLTHIPPQFSSKLPSQLTVLLKRERDTNLSAVTQFLQEARYSKLLLSLGKWLTRRSWRLHLEPAQISLLEAPIGEFAHRALSLLYEKVIAESRQLATISHEERHALRIRIKKLAYAVRFFGNLYPHQTTSPFPQKLSVLQEELGTLNDHWNALKVLQQLQINQQPGVHFLQGWYAGQEVIHLTQLDLAWTDWLSQPPFWNTPTPVEAIANVTTSPQPQN